MNKEVTIEILQALRLEMKAKERHMEAEALRTALDELESKEVWTNSWPIESEGDEWHDRAQLLWRMMRTTIAADRSKPEDVVEGFRRLYGPQGDKYDIMLRHALKQAEIYIKAIREILLPLPSEYETALKQYSRNM